MLYATPNQSDTKLCDVGLEDDLTKIRFRYKIIYSEM
jgi:hypothetical protein